MKSERKYLPPVITSILSVKRKMESMQFLKKTIVVFAALFMAFSMAYKVDAAETGITITNAIDGETYTAYKLLDATYAGELSDDTAIAYYYTGSAKDTLYQIMNQAGLQFDVFIDGKAYLKVADEEGNAIRYTEEQIKNLASYINAALTSDPAALVLKKAGHAIASKGSATIPVTEKGLYFVDTSLGSVCSIDTAGNVQIKEKNTITTLDKKQNKEAGDYTDDQLDVNIGDTVYYDAEIKIGKGADYEITGTDTLSAGLTLNHKEGDITVKIGDADVAEENYTLDADDSGFTIVFKADYISTLKEKDVIMIEYTAVVNQNALIREDNTNTWTIDYSKQHLEDSTHVKTYDVQVKKTDANTKEFLAGAGFKLYDAATEGNQITLAKDETGYYLSVEADEEILIKSADGENIRGLAPGTYYLEETTVPAGYNKLPARKEFTVIPDARVAVEITVENEAGTVLPSTGGIGTTIFHMAGAALVLGAGVLLIAKKRVNG